jgi:hypothetical protein
LPFHTTCKPSVEVALGNSLNKLIIVLQSFSNFYNFFVAVRPFIISPGATSINASVFLLNWQVYAYRLPVRSVTGEFTTEYPILAKTFNPPSPILFDGESSQFSAKIWHLIYLSFQQHSPPLQAL